MKENRCCKWKGCVALHAVPNEHRVAELRFVLICSFRSGKIEVPVYFIKPGEGKGVCEWKQLSPFSCLCS